LKRYGFPVAAVLAFTLGFTGVALAKGHSARSHHHRSAPAAARGFAHSLIPGFAPHPRAWLRALSELPRNPKSSHKAKPPRKPAPKRQAPKQQPRPRHQLNATTLSIYEQTVKPRFLSAQGCRAARRHESGVVVLDFGKPAFEHGGYGSILFSGRFAPNHKITAAMLRYARAYVGCLPKGSTASIELARGTSNYHPSVPSAFHAGRKWARETMTLQHQLRQTRLDAHVVSAAADDVEPAWDRSFRRTRDFYRGYASTHVGHSLYNYGSLDGGIVNGVWSAHQAFYVTGGMRYARPIPEIYNKTMARQWAALAQVARRRYHRPLKFAGVMTMHTSSNHGMKPREAHLALVRQLAIQGHGSAPAAVPAAYTNITADY